MSDEFPELEAQAWGRLVNDYRAINRLLRRMAGRMRNMPQALRELSGGIYKSLLDLLWGFNQLRCTERASKLLTVVTEDGCFEPTVCPFGVHNAPPAFQTVLDYEFDEYVANGRLIIFIDDFNVKTGSARKLRDHVGMQVDPKAFESYVVAVEQGNRTDKGLTALLDAAFVEHLETLTAVLKHATVVGVKFKISKMRLCGLVVEALGMRVGLSTLGCTESRVTSLVEWPRPTASGDVDAWLGATGFVRQLLSTSFSEAAKPLRSLLKARFTSGALKPATEGADADTVYFDGKRRPGQNAEVVRSGTLPWDDACEQAFCRTKDMVRELILTFEPDYEGAASGANPYFLFPDSSGFAIGSGLLQFAPLLVAEKGEDWVAYLERFKASLQNRTVDTDLIRKALLPLGLRSRTLNEVESRWAIRDKELAAVVDGIEFFLDIVGGCFVVVPMDHLNNMSVNSNNSLRSPEKVIRMMSYLAEVAHVQLLFHPGVGNPIGDGMSRNPVGRDEVMAKYQDIPSTWSAVAALMLDSRGHVQYQQEPAITRVWENTTRRVTQAVRSAFLPAVVDDTMPTVPRVGSYSVRLVPVLVVEPTCAVDGGNVWFAAVREGARKRELRRQVLDGGLMLLRLVRQHRLGAVVAHGPAVVPVAALLSVPLRDEAYAVRWVPELERGELEAAWANVRWIVLIVPGVPRGLPGLRDVERQLPELCTLHVRAERQVAVVVPLANGGNPVAQRVVAWFQTPVLVSALPADKRPSGTAWWRELPEEVPIEGLQPSTVVPGPRTQYTDRRDIELSQRELLDGKQSPICLERIAGAARALLPASQVVAAAFIQTDSSNDAPLEAYVATVDGASVVLDFDFEGLKCVAAFESAGVRGPQDRRLVVFLVKPHAAARQVTLRGLRTSLFDGLREAQLRWPASAAVHYALRPSTDREPRHRIPHPASGTPDLSKFSVLDGLVVRETDRGAMPWIPNVPVTAEGGAQSRTWRHRMLESAHDSLAGGHVCGQAFEDQLRALCWWEGLAADATRWTSRCPACTGVKRYPRAVVAPRSRQRALPFAELVWDLMEVAPPGPGGEVYINTIFCTATGYPAFRAQVTKSATETAWTLFVVLLDFGVCPTRLRSDQGTEFVNEVIEELANLLGVSLAFSVPWRPQSQGIAERSHREIWAIFAIYLEQLGLRFAEWPKLLPIAEHLFRHRTIRTTGVTPYALIHGFLGASPLETALGGVVELPTSLIGNEWLSDLVTQTQELACMVTKDQLALEEKDGLVRAPEFSEGDLVFLQHHDGIKGVTPKLLPKATGPWLILEMKDRTSVVLGDPFTGEPRATRPFTDAPQAVHVGQLVRFPYDAAWFREHAIAPEPSSDVWPTGTVALFMDTDVARLVRVTAQDEQQVSFVELLREAKRGRPSLKTATWVDGPVGACEARSLKLVLYLEGGKLSRKSVADLRSWGVTD